MLNDCKFNYLTGNYRFTVVCVIFDASPCTCRWWLFLIIGSHAFSMGERQCLLCRADGAQSINQGSALNEAVSYVVLTLFAEEGWRWAGHERWGLLREQKGCQLAKWGCQSSQWQGRCEVLGSPLFYSSVLRDYSPFSSTSSALWGRTHASEGGRRRNDPGFGR